MILSASKIKECVNHGEIKIHPFNERYLNPNSIDVTLSDTLKVYTENIINSADKEHNLTSYLITDGGFLLKPGILYLGATIESTVSDRYVPILSGKSSIGRLGIVIHQTAGFGDLGWGYTDSGVTYPTWTLEITVTQPVRIYPKMKIGQVYFLSVLGDIKDLYKGNYQNQKLPTAPNPSSIYNDRM